ncbi:MAG: DUF2914 domain-containing protein, partial [Myxococcales bacterium]|nr:DUF2914 domain-containing protein [Myxococcales bacterium]
TPATSVGASARAPGAPTQREGVERPPLRVFEGGTPASSPPASPPQPVRPARAERPAEPEVPTEPASSGQTPWLWIGVGVLALGVGGYLVVGGKSSGPGSVPQISAGDSGPEPVTKPPAPSGGSADEATSADAPPAETDSDSGGSTPPTSRSDDPREPPPGTPDEIAAVFRRLPVSPSDGPPIGGIGANGIHIDELRMGTDVDGTCSTLTDEFSVSGLDRAGVCVRVVHPREKDELQVLWQKHGGYTRRSKMVVLPKHAYRTRGYLKLRSEYIGEWTVRILSSDGVELARHEFTVVP